MHRRRWRTHFSAVRHRAVCPICRSRSSRSSFTKLSALAKALVTSRSRVRAAASSEEPACFAVFPAFTARSRLSGASFLAGGGIDDARFVCDDALSGGTGLRRTDGSMSYLRGPERRETCSNRELAQLNSQRRATQEEKTRAPYILYARMNELTRTRMNEQASPDPSVWRCHLIPKNVWRCHQIPDRDAA